MSELVLYHGSNVIVEHPKLMPYVRALDFGAGFYLTSDFEQACKWARITTKRRGNGNPYVSKYVLKKSNFDGLSVIHFDKPSVEWLKFVSMHRSGLSFDNEYDIVIGPVANDNTMPVINLYLKGDYTEEEALKRLLPQKLKDQFAFKSEKAVTLLKLSEVTEL